jgi:phosphate transport system permease protein
MSVVAIPQTAVRSAPRNLGDRMLRGVLRIAALLLVVLVVAIVVEMLRTAQPAVRTFGWRFLFTSTWDPVAEHFGVVPFVYGTLVSSLLALLLAVPLGIGAAIYLAELAPAWIRPPLAFLVELVAAVPSVIYGLWGIFVLAPFLRKTVDPFLANYFGWTGLFSGPQYGIGMLAAGVILSIMIVPFISSVTREVMLAVPSAQREAVMALGATRWETIRIGVLRNARAGVFGGIILALGRALGETMAVTMLIGNRPEVAKSLFAPGYTMASVIANEFSEATDDLYLSALVEVGLALFIVTVIVNIIAQLMIWTITRGHKAGAHA